MHLRAHIGSGVFKSLGWLPVSKRVDQIILNIVFKIKIVSEYDQEIPQSQTADNPVAP